MVVYDRGVKAAGIAERVMEQVKKAGVKAVVFDGVIPNPTNEVIRSSSNCKGSTGGRIRSSRWRKQY